MTIHDNIPIYQWEGLDIHFGCTYKGVRYWRTHGTGTDSDKWDICYEICFSWRKIGTPIPPLQYLVITGEHFDIERIIEEANRNERPNDDIPLYQSENVNAIWFYCTYRGVMYYRVYKSGMPYQNKWSIRGDWCEKEERGPQISRLQYLVITGEPFDIEKVLKEARDET